MFCGECSFHPSISLALSHTVASPLASSVEKQNKTKGIYLMLPSIHPSIHKQTAISSPHVSFVRIALLIGRLSIIIPD
jgi:hypothetical protein